MSHYTTTRVTSSDHLAALQVAITLVEAIEDTFGYNTPISTDLAAKERKTLNAFRSVCV